MRKLFTTGYGLNKDLTTCTAPDQIVNLLALALVWYVAKPAHGQISKCMVGYIEAMAGEKQLHMREPPFTPPSRYGDGTGGTGVYAVTLPSIKVASNVKMLQTSGQ